MGCAKAFGQGAQGLAVGAEPGVALLFFQYAAYQRRSTDHLCTIYFHYFRADWQKSAKATAYSDCGVADHCR